MTTAPRRGRPQVREHRIDGRELFVLDDVLTPGARRALGASLAALPFRRAERDRPGTRMRGFVANFDVARCADQLIVRAVRARLNAHFPAERFVLQRMYCNNNVYGDMAHPHRDCPTRSRSVTGLYYANLTWDPEWGGETLFYDRTGDAVACVTPRPGRLVLFRGAILHRSGVPARECYDQRLALALKFRALGARAAAGAAP